MASEKLSGNLSHRFYGTGLSFMQWIVVTRGDTQLRTTVQTLNFIGENWRGWRGGQGGLPELRGSSRSGKSPAGRLRGGKAGRAGAVGRRSEGWRQGGISGGRGR